MTDEVMLRKSLELAQECVLTSREYLNDKGAFNLAGELSAIDIILSELIRLLFDGTIWWIAAGEPAEIAHRLRDDTCDKGNNHVLS